MATNVEIIRTGTENALSVLRKFTRRVQGSGVLPRVRSIRYSERTLSHFKVKRAKINYLKRTAKHAELLKLGKIVEVKPRGRR
jgi:ribosomal protein S21